MGGHPHGVSPMLPFFLFFSPPSSMSWLFPVQSGITQGRQSPGGREHSAQAAPHTRFSRVSGRAGGPSGCEVGGLRTCAPSRPGDVDAAVLGPRLHRNSGTNTGRWAAESSSAPSPIATVTAAGRRPVSPSLPCPSEAL